MLEINLLAKDFADLVMKSYNPRFLASSICDPTSTLKVKGETVPNGSSSDRRKNNTRHAFKE